MINPVSKKQARKNRELRRVKEEMMAEHEGCFFSKQGYLPFDPWPSCWGMMEHHHIISLARGGKHEKSNLVALCEGCHDRIHHTVEGRRTAVRLGLLKRNPERVTHG